MMDVSIITQIFKNRQTNLKSTFLRAQVVSLVATTIDFIISIISYELIQLHYVASTTLGGICGAITSFLLGRNWVFLSKSGKVTNQAIRFLIITFFSIFFNTSGVFFFKELFNLPFILSRVFASIMVGVFFNFLMNRYFVFR